MLPYIDEYRDPQLAKQYVDALQNLTKTSNKTWKIMEACGGQTHTIVKFGIDQMIPQRITLLHGPGCPVCVTPISVMDTAIELSKRKNTVLCSFGDMLRVPGTTMDLLRCKAQGADIRIVYSPLDSLKIAQKNPEKEVIFFAVGFETTTPANAMAVHQASLLGLKNFSILASQVLVPPALEAILRTPDHQVQGFLAPGHVCTIAGYEQYERLSEQYQIPIVVTGFEPADILQGLTLCIQQLEKGEYRVQNQYTRSVQKNGNLTAQKMVQEIFELSSIEWRGLGEIPESGMKLRQKYQVYDAKLRFQTNFQDEKGPSSSESKCLSGKVLMGVLKPPQCPEFGQNCSPENPLGATMVSSEGACAAYYRYRFSQITDIEEMKEPM